MSKEDCPPGAIIIVSINCIVDGSREHSRLVVRSVCATGTSHDRLQGEFYLTQLYNVVWFLQISPGGTGLWNLSGH